MTCHYTECKTRAKWKIVDPDRPDRLLLSCDPHKWLVGKGVCLILVDLDPPKGER